MKLKCYYSMHQGDAYMTSHCFKAIVDALEKSNPSIDFERVNNAGMAKLPYMKFGYHNLIIENPDNNKYIAVSYQDKLHSMNDHLGWDMDNCVELFASSGKHVDDVHYRELQREVTPFCYPVSTRITYQAIEDIHDSKKTLQDKPPFRGYLYNLREHLSKDDRFDITDEKIPFDEYIKELSKNIINMSLNGAGEICQRCMEILGTGTVLFREKLTNTFHNSLIPGYHYIAVDCDSIKHITNHDEYFEAQAELYIQEYNKAIKLDRDILETIAENGRTWYLNNTTPEAQGSVASQIIDLHKLQ